METVDGVTHVPSSEWKLLHLMQRQMCTKKNSIDEQWKDTFDCHCHCTFAENDIRLDIETQR